MDRVPTATQPSEELLLRAVQLYELLPIRTGVMLLGPAAGGKTTVRQVLQLALSKEGRALQCAHIYPKVGGCHAHSSWELVGVPLREPQQGRLSCVRGAVEECGMCHACFWRVHEHQTITGG